MNWPRLIRELRHLEQLKQDQLAYQLGVSQASISQWERGVIAPPKRFQSVLRQRTMASPSNRLLQSLKVSIATTQTWVGLFPIRSGRWIFHSLSQRAYEDYALLSRDDVGEAIEPKLGEDTAEACFELLDGGLLSSEFSYAESLHANVRDGVEHYGIHRCVPFKVDHDDWVIRSELEPINTAADLPEWTKGGRVARRFVAWD